MSAEEKLERFLNEGKPWERLATSIHGVFVLKLPPYQGQSSQLVVELNPVDKYLKPTKRRGLVLRSTLELEAFNEIYQPERINNLLTTLKKINPGSNQKRKKIIEL